MHVPLVPGLAVGGKTTRGARTDQDSIPYLLAAVTRTGVVLAQCQVADKSNEITAFIALLSGVDLTGMVITSGAMQTQRASARFLHQDKNAHVIFPVLDNQPTLFERLDALDCKDVAVTAHTADHDRQTLARAAAMGLAGEPAGRLWGRRPYVPGGPVFRKVGRRTWVATGGRKLGTVLGASFAGRLVEEELG